MNRGWLWALLGLCVGVAVGFFAFQGGPGRANPQNPSPATPVRVPEPTPEERERRELGVAVRGADGDLVQAVRAGTGWTLGVELPRRPVQLDQLERDAMRLFREIKRTGVSVDRVALLVRTDQLKDVYGNPLKDVAIARVGLSGATFQRINWDGFDPRNFPRVAEEFWLHPELQQELVRRDQAEEAGQSQAGGQGEDEQGGGTGSGGGGGSGG